MVPLCKTHRDIQVVGHAGNGTPGNSDGQGDAARFNQPYSVQVDQAGRLQIPGQLNHSIWCINPDGQVSAVASSGKAGLVDDPVDSSHFNQPLDVGFDVRGGRLVVSEDKGHRLQGIAP